MDAFDSSLFKHYKRDLTLYSLKLTLVSLDTNNKLK